MNDRRQLLIDSVQRAISYTTTEAECLQAAIELIDGYSDGWHWTGFYLDRDGVLEIGPYVGPETPHTRIEYNSGICGAAASQKKSIVVDDVNADPRFLACSLTTRSEVVVPLLDGDRVIGEIDIDSNNPSYFTDDDRVMLETVAEVVVERLREIAG